MSLSYQLIRNSKQLLAAWVIFIMLCVTSRVLAASDAYGNGDYGTCTYNTCGITLTSNGTVGLNVIPTTSTTCTIQSDSVAVTTDSSTGYTLSMNNASASSNLLGSGASSIPTSTGTLAAPTALTANTWGFRVDGLGGFGVGPTTASSNTGPSSTTFAGIPSSAQTSATLATSSVAANPAVNTTVWYGACVDTNLSSDIYQSSVIYTAVVN